MPAGGYPWRCAGAVYTPLVELASFCGAGWVLAGVRLAGGGDAVYTPLVGRP